MIACVGQGVWLQVCQTSGHAAGCPNCERRLGTAAMRVGLCDQLRMSDAVHWCRTLHSSKRPPSTTTWLAQFSLPRGRKAGDIRSPCVLRLLPPFQGAGGAGQSCKGRAPECCICMCRSVVAQVRRDEQTSTSRCRPAHRNRKGQCLHSCLRIDTRGGIWDNNSSKEMQQDARNTNVATTAPTGAWVATPGPHA